jgi:hypothetical protein
MDQQREETTQQQSRRLKERLGEQFEIRDRALRQEFGRVHEKIDDLVKDSEARDKGIKREFRNVYEKMDQMSQKLDKIDTLETSFAIFEATFANFKVAHLNQRIQAIPMYDSFHQPVPVPKCFPKRLSDSIDCKIGRTVRHCHTLLRRLNLLTSKRESIEDPSQALQPRESDHSACRSWRALRLL